MISIEQDRMILNEAALKMFNLCELQLINTKKAFYTLDHDLAEEVLYLEKRVNAMDIKIDRKCERFIALHQPVAHNLSFVLGLRKINFRLERIGEYCINMSRYISEMRELPNKKILTQLEMDEMFSSTISMMQDVSEAYHHGDRADLRKIAAKQQNLEDIYRKSFEVISREVKTDATLIDQYLLQFTLIRKLEVIGSHILKIAEEVNSSCEAEIWKYPEMKFEWD